MKEKLWVFDFGHNRVLCCYVDEDTPIEDYLRDKGITDNYQMFWTDSSVELEIYS